MRHGWLVLVLAALAISMPLSAQNEAPAAGDAPPVDAGDAAEAEAAAAAAAAAAAEESEPPGAADTRRAEDEEDDDFVPSEEILPDEQVVFPVDI
jgi:hypothetical protein